jgi:hypothetical protein
VLPPRPPFVVITLICKSLIDIEITNRHTDYNGFQSRDLNVFKGQSVLRSLTLLAVIFIGKFVDTDGTGYLLTEDRANGLRIDLLSSDYLSVVSATYLYAQDYEAPALYKSGSTYFMFASHESGWCKFNSDLTRSTDLL